VVALARATFVAGIAAILGFTAVIVASGDSYPDPSVRPTQTGLWVYSLGFAIPVTLLALLVVRRAFFPRRAAAAAATLIVVALLALSPAAFRPAGGPTRRPRRDGS
jgi:hypothetical protein